MTRHRFPIALAALALAGCSDGPPTAPDTGELSKVIVSEALQRPVSVTYVSLPPGTMPHVVSIRIRNASAGGPVSPTIPLVNGGFDPVAVPASPDDRLELQLTDHDGNVTEEIAMVPIKRPPVVVRISPPNGRTDVALSVHPGVVFSEPVDPSTLAVGMRLVTGSLMVTGRIELREPWRAELAPDSPLAPGTTYRVELTREIRGADGEPLERPAEAAFTTAAGPPLPEAPLSRMRIAFVSSRDGSDQIYLANGDGSGLTHLTAGTGPAWSWDDLRIAFHRNGPSGPVIGVINADGTEERILGPGMYPAWSPDGRLAFVSLRNDDGGIAVMNADGTGYIQLLSHDFASPGCEPPTSIYAWWGDCVTYPKWSPDGHRIVFFAGDVGYGTSQVYVMQADGSSPILLVSDQELERNHGWNGREPTWAPDGSRVAFVWGGPGSLISALDPDGAGTLAFLAAGNDPSWSPDGHWIAYRGDVGPFESRIAATNVGTGEFYGQLIPEVSAPENPDYYDYSPEWGYTIR